MMLGVSTGVTSLAFGATALLVDHSNVLKGGIVL